MLLAPESCLPGEEHILPSGWFVSARSGTPMVLILPLPRSRTSTWVIQLLAKKYGVDDRGTRPKSYLGIPELCQLLDVDMQSTPCIEYAESHHLAWLISRVTACHPSALGPPGSCPVAEAIKANNNSHACVVTTRPAMGLMRSSRVSRLAPPSTYRLPPATRALDSQFCWLLPPCPGEQSAIDAQVRLEQCHRVFSLMSYLSRPVHSSFLFPFSSSSSSSSSSFSCLSLANSRHSRSSLVPATLLFLSHLRPSTILLVSRPPLSRRPLPRSR